MIGKYIVITEKKFEQNEYLTPINFFSMPWVFQKYAHHIKKQLLIFPKYFSKKRIRKSGFPNPKIYKYYTMHTQKKRSLEASLEVSRSPKLSLKNAQNSQRTPCGVGPCTPLWNLPAISHTLTKLMRLFKIH